MNIKLLKSVVATSLLCATPFVNAASPSAISDEVIVPSYEGYDRTAPLFELGQPFLDTGNIDPGFEIPGGAVWQPEFFIFGDYRTALQYYDNNGSQSDEWANRLNLFGQLKLTGTERFLLGLRPLDEDGRRYSGYLDGDSVNAFNLDVETFYFEGEFGEIFPNLDPDDTKRLDWGFAVGRQPLLVQEGLMINDTMEGLGIVRNSLSFGGVPNLRMTGFVGWSRVNRNDNQTDDDATLYGLFSEFDTTFSTVDIDLAYVDSAIGGHGYYVGLSAVQRFGHTNTSFRALYSEAVGEDSPSVSTGTLLFAETSITPTATHDNAYLNGFVAFDRFSSAARNGDVGGPLGRTGILFQAVGLGQYGSALSNRTEEAYGASLGYQKFMDSTRKQIIFELGGRKSTDISEDQEFAFGMRYQQAVGRHMIIVLDGFVSESGLTGSGNGVRTEFRWKF